MADRLVLPTDLYPVAPRRARTAARPAAINDTDCKAVSTPSETPSVAAAPTKHTTLAIPTADSDTAAGGRLELDALPADRENTPLEYIDPKEWSDFPSRRFADCLPPSGTTIPCLWNPRHDEADNFFNGQRENFLPRRVSTHALLWCIYGRR
jgi:hypothetical protein